MSLDWDQIQNQLSSTDKAIQKAAIEALREDSSQEAIDVLKHFLRSKLYYGVPAEVITDLIGQAAYEGGGLWIFYFGSWWKPQLTLDGRQRVVDVLGFGVSTLPQEAPPYKKLARKKIYPPVTDLVDAVEKKDIGYVKKFIKQRGDLDGRVNGWTALGKAANEGNVEIVALLVEAGASIEAPSVYISDVDGYTPLMLACSYAGIEVIRYLVKSGANVNAQNENGKSVFMEAAWSNQDESVEAVKLLVENGADTTLKDSGGRTGSSGARNRDVIEYLRTLR